MTRVHWKNCSFSKFWQKRSKMLKEIMIVIMVCYSLRKRCPYLEFFWSVFSRIGTEYGDLLCKSPYSVQRRENTGQKNYKYEQIFLGDFSVDKNPVSGKILVLKI